MLILKGNRPRPRVALIGNFEEDTIKSFGNLFPTFWMAETLTSLSNLVNYREVDLLIIGPRYSLSNIDYESWDFITNAHVICFSSAIPYLPGPSNNCSIQMKQISLTEQYVVPALSIGKFSLLESDLLSVDNAKGWILLDLEVRFRRSNNAPDSEQKKVIAGGSLIYDPHTKLSFATIFKRIGSDLGIAWLPIDRFSIVPWVELICTEWANSDRERFPNFGDWTKNPEWMTSEEIELKLEVDNLNLELNKLTTEYKTRISKAEVELSHTALMINNGKRRLITSQGDELVREVAQSFEDIGYSVTIVDDELDETVPKKEDLRISDPDVNNWEAIVEVRGHTKSSGQTADLNRLPKFAKLYRAETGREPDKLIYVVNGQIELSSPKQRQMSFASAPDDVEVFGEQDGLIIWTLDLFKLFRLVRSDNDKVLARKSIRDKVGRWLPDRIE